MDETFNIVKALIMDVLKIDGDEITMDTRLIEDLKADSMDQFFMVDGLCEKFDIDISNEEARAFVRSETPCAWWKPPRNPSNPGHQALINKDLVT